MGLKLGTTDISDVRLGATQVASIYLGGNLIWNSAQLTEAEKVIARMSLPSQAFQDAITILVEAEQAALGDNWNLTDDVIMFDVDTEINALIGWKKSAQTLIGTSSITPYTGANILQDGSNNYIDSDYIIGEVMKANDSYLSILAEFAETDINQRYFYWFLRGGCSSCDTQTNIEVNDSKGQQGKWFGLTYNAFIYRMYTNVNRVTVGTPIETLFYNDNELLSSQPAAASVPLGNLRIGNSEFSDAHRVLNGTFKHAIMGSSEIDIVANNINVKNFHDAMLIQKHISEVNTVLNRYTNLSTIETWAISRLVAKSEENGNWVHVVSCLLELYISANASIDLQAVAGDGILPDQAEYDKEKNIADNELAIGLEPSKDYNIQNNTYDWGNIDLQADQCESLVGIIDSESDGTTTGRTLDITDAGITLNANISIESLITKGWNIIKT